MHKNFSTELSTERKNFSSSRRGERKMFFFRMLHTNTHNTHILFSHRDVRKGKFRTESSMRCFFLLRKICEISFLCLLVLSSEKIDFFHSRVTFEEITFSWSALNLFLARTKHSRQSTVFTRDTTRN